MKTGRRGSRLRRRGVLLMTLGAVMIVGALSLFIFNRQESLRAERLSNLVEESLQEEMENGTLRYSGSHPSETNPTMATITIGSYDYIGTIDIPRFGLELPVMSEWSYDGLQIAPGRYYGSVWSHDLVIAAHNYNRHFGQIKNLDPGDTVIFTDVLGNVFTYHVKEVTTLGPYAIEEMISGDWDLTLFTCTYGGRTRVTVRCDEVSEEESGEEQNG